MSASGRVAAVRLGMSEAWISMRVPGTKVRVSVTVTRSLVTMPGRSFSRVAGFFSCARKDRISAGLPSEVARSIWTTALSVGRSRSYSRSVPAETIGSSHCTQARLSRKNSVAARRSSCVRNGSGHPGTKTRMSG